MFPLRLSQAHLNLLEACPRKFQHLYLEQLRSPDDPAQLERLQQGSQFHLLMQQWQMDLPIEPFLLADEQLRRWFDAFVQQAPTILALESGGEPLRQSEHTRVLWFDGYLLTVVYDLLLTNDQQAAILDWKTYPRPQTSTRLRHNWQTRLYPFVLAETTAYQPEQISMTYWFFQASGEPAQSLRLPYSLAQHEQTRADLSRLLSQLTANLERYEMGEPFPQVALGSDQCESCRMAVRCDRTSSPSLLSELDPTVLDWTEIAEIPL